MNWLNIKLRHNGVDYNIIGQLQEDDTYLIRVSLNGKELIMFRIYKHCSISEFLATIKDAIR